MPVPANFTSSSSRRTSVPRQKPPPALAGRVDVADHPAAPHRDDPLDHLVVDRRRRLRGLGVGEVVEAEDRLQGFEPVFGVGEREVVEVQVRDQPPVGAAAGGRTQRRGRQADRPDPRERGGGLQLEDQPLAGPSQKVGLVAVRAGRLHDKRRIAGPPGVEVEIDQRQVNVGAAVSLATARPARGVIVGTVPVTARPVAERIKRQVLLRLANLLCRSPQPNRPSKPRPVRVGHVGNDRYSCFAWVNGIGSAVFSKRFTTGVQPSRNVSGPTPCASSSDPSRSVTSRSTALPNPARASRPNPFRSTNRNLAGRRRTRSAGGRRRARATDRAAGSLLARTDRAQAIRRVEDDRGRFRSLVGRPSDDRRGVRKSASWSAETM